MDKWIAGLMAAALAAAISGGTAHADDNQVGAGNISGTGTAHTHNNVSIVTINGVTTVTVDGVVLHGEEAQAFIDGMR